MTEPLDLFPEPGKSGGGRRGGARPPLADRMRPKSFDEFEGGEALVGPRTLLGTAVATGNVPSVILWGPPGSGKTTLARLLAESSKARFEQFSAVTSGVKEVREVIERARTARRAAGTPTILFVDEIHR